MADLTKKQEIELLEKLVNGNGYFAEYFQKDFQQMKRNIEVDHPIEMETKFNQYKEMVSGYEVKVDDLTYQFENLTSKLAQREGAIAVSKQIMTDILIGLVQNKEFDKVSEPTDYFTWEAVVKTKLEKGYQLTDEQAQKLIEKAGL